jgi:hypothetical protein
VKIEARAETAVAGVIDAAVGVETIAEAAVEIAAAEASARADADERPVCDPAAADAGIAPPAPDQPPPPLIQAGTQASNRPTAGRAITC